MADVWTCSLVPASAAVARLPQVSMGQTGCGLSGMPARDAGAWSWNVMPARDAYLWCRCVMSTYDAGAWCCPMLLAHSAGAWCRHVVPVRDVGLRYWTDAGTRFLPMMLPPSNVKWTSDSGATNCDAGLLPPLPKPLWFGLWLRTPTRISTPGETARRTGSWPWRCCPPPSGAAGPTARAVITTAVCEAEARPSAWISSRRAPGLIRPTVATSFRCRWCWPLADACLRTGYKPWTFSLLNVFCCICRRHLVKSEISWNV